MERAGAPIEGHTALGMIPSAGPNRVSYFMDLHGPSEPVETACSSSLVAVHHAVVALHSGQCEMAVAGGVNVLLTPDIHISMNKAGALSTDGRCRTFSADANGYVRSEGVGMLLLKPLSRAEADGDQIYGIIRGSGVNHGGRATSLTAPNPAAQEELLKTVYRQAGVDPATVTYVEAHGTGTRLGDPIEIDALKAAFGTAPGARCGLGSVKSNIGHTELAAGVAGVIKTLLQMKHRTLVKSLHAERLNPYIRLDGSPFYVVQENAPWTALRNPQGEALPRRAGVSSFGIGGVNAHVILEEYPAPAIRPASRAWPAPVMVLSARDEHRLEDAARQLEQFLSARRLFRSMTSPTHCRWGVRRWSIDWASSPCRSTSFWTSCAASSRGKSRRRCFPHARLMANLCSSAGSRAGRSTGGAVTATRRRCASACRPIPSPESGAGSTQGSLHPRLRSPSRNP